MNELATFAIDVQPESEYDSPWPGVPRIAFAFWATSCFMMYPWLRGGQQVLGTEYWDRYPVRPPKREQAYVFKADTANAH